MVILSPTRDYGVMVTAMVFGGLALLGLAAFLSIFDYCCGLRAKFWGPVGICGLFLAVGIWLFWLAARPVRFELDIGVFWFGFSKKPHTKTIPIAEIKCLKNHVTFDSSYTNESDQYKLMAEMSSGAELSLAYYAYLDDINADGKKLAQLLKVPFVERG